MKRNPYLRVKIKTLAEEAKIIRHAERFANKYGDYAIQNKLRNHRTTTVRQAARNTLLAYQYLRGIPYAAIERPDSKPVNWKEVERMCRVFGPGVKLDHKAWVAGANLAKAA